MYQLVVSRPVSLLSLALRSRGCGYSRTLRGAAATAYTTTRTLHRSRTDKTADTRCSTRVSRHMAQRRRASPSRWRRSHSHEPWTAANRNYHSCMDRGEVPIALLSLNSSLPFESAPWRARS